ncbi:unnamed protein product, partial [Iphiclides podalirius]
MRRRWTKQPAVDPPAGTQLVHRLCPHHNVVQRFAVEQKDSLDDHLDALTRKLAEKEGRLRLSKSKIRQTQNEIDNLHAIDNDVRQKYREIMDSLRTDLMSNETECKRLQEQIEWVSRRRAELHEEVQRGEKLHGEAAVQLAANLAEFRRGRECRVTDKPHMQSSNDSVRQRRTHITGADPVASVIMKCKTCSTPEPPRRCHHQQ